MNSPTRIEINNAKRLLKGKSRAEISVEAERGKGFHQVAARELIDELDQLEGEKKHWWTRYSATVTTFSFLLALTAFLAGRYWPTTQVSSLERRVLALEQRQPTATTNPQPISMPSLSPSLPSTLALPVPSSTPAPKTTPNSPP